MTNEELLRERVAKLEVQMTHLSEKLDDTHKKVEEMHAILLQAKGARWVIVGLAGVAGLASGLVAKVDAVVGGVAEVMSAFCMPLNAFASTPTSMARGRRFCVGFEVHPELWGGAFMKRRATTGDKAGKARRRKTTNPKRRTALRSPAAIVRQMSICGSDNSINGPANCYEAREQQAATAQILRTISTSPTDVQPVFETIVRHAVTLCGSLFANVFRFDGELLHHVASHNVGKDYVDLLQAKYPMRPDSSQVSGRVVLTKSVVRLEDALTDPDYDQRFPLALGWRRMLGVPMLRGGNPLGVIVVGWAQAGPVPKAQEELLTTFADQAVIAIENVRLFEAEQQRTRDLSEALEQQIATSEVLQGHQQLARRAGAGVQDDAGECHPHLRCQVRRHVFI